MVSSCGDLRRSDLRQPYSVTEQHSSGPVPHVVEDLTVEVTRCLEHPFVQPLTPVAELFSGPVAAGSDESVYVERDAAASTSMTQ